MYRYPSISATALRLSSGAALPALSGTDICRSACAAAPGSGTTHRTLPLPYVSSFAPAGE